MPVVTAHINVNGNAIDANNPNHRLKCMSIFLARSVYVYTISFVHAFAKIHFMQNAMKHTGIVLES